MDDENLIRSNLTPWSLCTYPFTIRDVSRALNLTETHIRTIIQIHDLREDGLGPFGDTTNRHRFLNFWNALRISISNNAKLSRNIDSADFEVLADRLHDTIGECSREIISCKIGQIRKHFFMDSIRLCHNPALTKLTMGHYLSELTIDLLFKLDEVVQAH